MSIKESFNKLGVHLIDDFFLDDEIEAILRLLPELNGVAGRRDMLLVPDIHALATSSRLLDLARHILGESAQPRRAIIFDKSPTVNWVLGFHQDLKIAVDKKIEIAGYTAWSDKEGIPHCQPPEAILNQCVALRIHLDDCPATNGPLKVKVGSHRFGVRPDFPQNCSETVCEARKGDVLLMHPLVWHASSKADLPSHRRVLHIEYSAAELEPPLKWAFG